MANEASVKEETKESQKAPAKKPPLVIIAAAGAFIALLIAGGIITRSVMSKPQAKGSEEMAVVHHPPIIAELSPFTVNLKPGSDGKLWLYNATIALELRMTESHGEAPAASSGGHGGGHGGGGGSASSGVPEIDQRMDQIRYLISSCIGSQSKDVLRTAEGRDNLRREVIRAVNTVLNTGEVENVYFIRALYTTV